VNHDLVFVVIWRPSYFCASGRGPSGPALGENHTLWHFSKPLKEKKAETCQSFFIIKHYYQKLNLKIKANHYHHINIQLFTSPGYAECGRKNISS